MMIVQIHQDYQLQSLNTFGLAARARHFAEFRSELALKRILLSDAWRQAPRHLILGGGSNMLLRGDFDGFVAHNAMMGRDLREETDHEVVLVAGAGENWHELVQYAISQGWGGIENLSLIPGRVGAAPIQNIGAYGVELKDVFEFLDALHLETGEVTRFLPEDCDFGYRESVFKQELKGQYAILRVALRLQKAPHALNTSYGAINDELAGIPEAERTIRDVSDAVIRIRQSKLPDPAVIGNSGSFFKNPEVPMATYARLKAEYPAMPAYEVSDTVMKIPAGWLIEQAGWKGKRFGNYGVHDRQALVLVNHGGAKGEDIFQLSSQILDDVEAKFGIRLEREVNVIG